MNQNREHGLVFHYFHDLDKYKKCQGSLDLDDFVRMLDYLQSRYKLLNPEEWMFRFKHGRLNDDDMLLTFDGGLKSQIDIAYKILKDRNLKAAYYIYTSPLIGEYPIVELCHDFRFSMYSSVDDFYDEFFDEVVTSRLIGDLDETRKLVKKEHYLSWGAFYTENDRLFKYIRDMLLTEEEYSGAIYKMMEQKGYLVHERVEDLWLDSSDIKKLCNDGNVVGTHSHSHPSKITNLSRKDIKEEYYVSKDILEKITGSRICSMSHPANSYNETVLEVLKECGYEMGFCNGNVKQSSPFLISRIDHANIMRNLKWQKE